MSEIKGQLLGIILVLVIFGSVSAVIASLFNATKDEIATRTETIVSDTTDLMTVNGD